MATLLMSKITFNGEPIKVKFIIIMAQVTEFENNGASVGFPALPTHSIHDFLQNLPHSPHSSSPLSNMFSLSDDLFFDNFDEI